MRETIRGRGERLEHHQPVSMRNYLILPVQRAEVCCKKRDFCTQTLEGIGGQVSEEEWSEQAPDEEKVVPI